MDFKQMASDLGIGKDDFMELVDLLITTSLSDLETLALGIQSNDNSQAAGAAHSIKGAAGNMGFMDISKKAAAVEAAARAGNLDTIQDMVDAIRQDLLNLQKIIGQ
ncbi:MAG: Hpt domain-containing protein [Pseudomonadota bacterium]